MESGLRQFGTDYLQLGTNDLLSHSFLSHKSTK